MWYLTFLYNIKIKKVKKVELIRNKVPSTQAMKENIRKIKLPPTPCFKYGKMGSPYKYAQIKGIKFRVITEKELFLFQGKAK